MLRRAASDLCFIFRKWPGRKKTAERVVAEYTGLPAEACRGLTACVWLTTFAAISLPIVGTPLFIIGIPNTLSEYGLTCLIQAPMQFLAVLLIGGPTIRITINRLVGRVLGGKRGEDQFEGLLADHYRRMRALSPSDISRLRRERVRYVAWFAVLMISCLADQIWCAARWFIGAFQRSA
jgi:hypothetical protein